MTTADAELKDPLFLRAWPFLWRTAVCLLAGMVIWYVNYQGTLEDPVALKAQRGPLLLELVVALLACPIITIRRTHPRLAFGLSAAASLLSTACFPFLWVTFAILAERRQRRELSVASTVFLLVSVVNRFWIGDYLRTDTPFGGKVGYWLIISLAEAMIGIALLAIGISRGNHRELMRSLEEGAELARREQQARVAQAQLTERARIAREMHDVLAHKISLISLHAGVLVYQAELTDDERQETARLIQQTSHQALEELREVLGVLRSDGTAANAKPQPSLLDLPSLIAAEESAGTQIVLDVPDDLWARAETIGATTTRHAHRIIQESLTNARKHATGRPVRVSVHGDETMGLDITVRNQTSGEPSTVPGAGLGLAGLRERAQLAGGTLETTQGPGWFMVHARLPWDAKMGS